MDAQAKKGPITRDLALVFACSMLISALMAVLSVAGLLLGPTGLYGVDAKIAAGVATGPAGVLVPGFVAQDAVNLAAGLPILLGSLWLTRKGSLVGLLLLPGVLFNVLYVYIHYVVGAPLSVLLLAYVALTALSALTLSVLVARIDRDRVRHQLLGRVPARTIGGLLIGLASVTAAQDAGGAFETVVAGSLHVSGAQRVWIADLAIVVPTMLVAGVLLWRRATLGYLVAPGLLLSFCVFSAELAVMLALQPQLSGSPIDVGTIAGLLVFAAAALIPLAFVVRAARGERAAATGRGWPVGASTSA